jgi:hypothetical protein
MNDNVLFFPGDQGLTRETRLPPAAASCGCKKRARSGADEVLIIPKRVHTMHLVVAASAGAAGLFVLQRLF